MMGVGKSTIGKSLAKKLAYDFVDIDRIIEKRRVVQLIRSLKPKVKFFRKLESKITLKN